MARALKVFRTAAGFDDAFVAAPSRAAALRAWGASRDLFARGIAEEVTDEALKAAALARPGEVIRQSRGSAAQQLAALPEKAPDTSARAPRATPPPRRAPRPAPRPAPDRRELDEAEAALVRAEAAAARMARDFDAREVALARERRVAEREAQASLRAAERVRDRAARAFARASEEADD